MSQGKLTGVANSDGVVEQDPLDGLWQGYEGELRRVTRQLLALAEVSPAEHFSWRPAIGARSTSEIYMHVAVANFWLLNVTGFAMPADLTADVEKGTTSKPEVIAWLKRSLDAVMEARTKQNPQHLAHSVTIAGRQATVDGIYLRILVHANEHMGQLVGYSRMNGIAPPWSK